MPLPPRVLERLERPIRLNPMFVAWIAAAFCIAVLLATLPQPYWFDEANTIFYVRHNFWRMLQLVANDFSPPLYYVLLFGWVRLVGTNEVATALPSVAITLANIWLTYRLGRQLFDRRTGSVAAALYAVSFTAMWHAQETRMYALLTLLGIGLTITLHLLLTRKNQVDWWWYLGVAFLGVYTHYSFWFLILAHNLFVTMTVARGRTMLPFGRWVAIQLALMALYLPQLPILVDRVQHWYLAGTTWFDLTPLELPWWPLRSLVGLVYAPFAIEAREAFGPSWFMTMLAAVIGAVVFLSFVKVHFDRGTLQLSLHQRSDHPSLVTLDWLLVVPVLVLVVLQVTFIRYVIFIMPLLCCWFAFRISRIQPSRLVDPCLVIVISAAAVFNIMFFTHHARYFPTFHDRNLWPRITAYVQAHEQSVGKEIILFVFQEHEAAFRNYYRGKLPMVGFLPPSLAEVGDLELDRVRWISRSAITAENASEVAGFIAGYESIWLPSPDVGGPFDSRTQTWKWFKRHCELAELVTLHYQQYPVSLYRYTSCDAA